MKREKNAGGLFGLLARQYLLFTLALLAIAAAVFALWMLYTARLYRAPDWDGLLADPALAEGKWEALRRHQLASGFFQRGLVTTLLPLPVSMRGALEVTIWWRLLSSALSRAVRKSSSSRSSRGLL